jgi:hypothetical protein
MGGNIYENTTLGTEEPEQDADTKAANAATEPAKSSEGDQPEPTTADTNTNN